MSSNTSPIQLFRGLAHAMIAVLLLYPLFSTTVVIVSAISSFAFATLSPRIVTLRKTIKLRTSSWFLLAILFTATSFLLRHLLTSGPLFSLTANPTDALILGNCIFIATAAGSASLLLRKLSLEKPAWGALELALAVFSVANLFSAHRDGAINRPFEIADIWLAQGDDPSHAFLLIGGVGSVLLILILLSEQRSLRAILQFSILAVLLWFIYASTEWIGIPNSSKSQAAGTGNKQGEKGNSSGLKPKPKNQRPEKQFQFNHPPKNQKDQQAPKAVVIFQDDYSPPLDLYYFRQGVASQYNGKKLITSPQTDFNPDVITFFPTQKTQTHNDPKTIENRGRSSILIALLSEHSAPFGFEMPLAFEPTQNPNPSRFLRTYQASTATRPEEYWDLIESKVGNPLWKKETWKHFTEHPENPKYKKLAKQILKELLPVEIADFPFAQATAISQWLGKNGTYSLDYTLEKQSADPTADFLFGKRTGYCVHFAHAAAFLMRSVGLPARLASGYMSEEKVRQGGSALLLLAGDAHAWPELYLEDFGWVPVDVYPENVESEPPPMPDTDLQKLLGEMARGQTTQPPNPEPLVPKLKIWLRKALLIAAKITGWASFIALILLFTIKYWRKWIPKFSSLQSQPRVGYRAALDLLSEQKLTRNKGETREQFAKKICQEYPSFEKITALHLKHTFGQTTPDEQKRIQTELQQFKNEYKRNVKSTKRFLGAIKPWSWLFTK